MLEPDRDQIEVFTDALFRRASQGFVSLRAFHENDAAAKPYMNSAVQIAGTNLHLLNERAVQGARLAANYDKSIVFCPPICLLRDRGKATEANLLEGLALSVECDQHPLQALKRLREVLGAPTMVIASGGVWTDPATGQTQNKLHLHWRLKSPARGNEQLAGLKLARDLACGLVGGDASNKTIVHPIRWPGTWHRKNKPVLCFIVLSNPDNEIDLATALTALKATTPAKTTNGAAPGPAIGPAILATFGVDFERDGADWESPMTGIISGLNYHESIASLAAKMISADMKGGAAVNFLRTLMNLSQGPRDERWQSRYDDIQRAVETAEQKFKRRADAPVKPTSPKILTMKEFLARYEAPVYLVDELMQQGFFYSLTGNTGSGKSAIALLLCFCIVLGAPFGPHKVKKGRVVYIAKENAVDIRHRMLGMIEAFGVDVDQIERDFLIVETLTDLEKDLPAIAKSVEAFGPVDLVVIDTSAATFSGDDENNNPQILAHAMKQRKCCTIIGKPATLSLCHPIKGAIAQEGLVPRGGGAFLNETDGNFTAYPHGEKLSDLHWTAKFRGPDFEKLTFRFATVYPEKLKTPDGKPFPTVMAEIASEEQLSEATEKARFQETRMLKAMLTASRASIAELAKACGWMTPDGKPHKSLAHRVIKRLVQARLAQKEGEPSDERYTLTKKGEIEGERATNDARES
jgi:hypothetical protein